MREAIALMALQVVAKGETITVSDSGVVAVLGELFGTQAEYDPATRLASIYSISAVQAKIMLSTMEQDVLGDFRDYLNELAGFNVPRMQIANNIITMLGIPRKSNIVEVVQKLQESNNTPSPSSAEPEQVEEAVMFVMLMDVTAIRSDDSESFSIQEGNNGEPKDVRGCIEDWKKEELCPAKGEVGFVRKKKTTSEGVLCYVIVRHNLVVPVLEHGLRTIEEMDYVQKRVYNHVMAYDHGNVRLNQLNIK